MNETEIKKKFYNYSYLSSEMDRLNILQLNLKTPKTNEEKGGFKNYNLINIIERKDVIESQLKEIDKMFVYLLEQGYTREHTILMLKFKDRYTFEKISNKIYLSRSSVIRSYKKALKILTEKYKSGTI